MEDAWRRSQIFPKLTCLSVFFDESGRQARPLMEKVRGRQKQWSGCKRPGKNEEGSKDG